MVYKPYKAYIHVFHLSPCLIFLLNTLRGFCDLYSCGKFAHKKGDLYEIVSRQYMAFCLILLNRIDNYGCYAYFYETQKASS